MNISVAELSSDTGRYIDLADKEEITITRNGTAVARLVGARAGQKEAVRALIGALPSDIDYDTLRTERILK